MPCYDRISGSLKEVKKIYDRISGSLKEVKTGYDRISGSLRVYHKSGIALSELALGSKVLTPAGESFTLVAQNHYSNNCTTLWADSSKGSYAAAYVDANRDTAYSTALENILVSTTVYEHTTRYSASSANTTAATSKHFLLGAVELGYSATWNNQKKMSYFSSNDRRKRYYSGAAVKNWTRDWCKATAGNRAFYIQADGSVDYRVSTASHIFPAVNVPNSTLVSQNSDGTYTLQI